LSYQNYYERTKDKISQYWHTSTKLSLPAGSIIPDSSVLLNVHGKSMLLCLELHRWYRVLKIEKQLKSYWYVLARGTASDKYKIKTSPYILVVFEQDSCLNTTLERVVKNRFFTYLRKHILFKTHDHLMSSPFESRLNLDHQKINLLGYERQD